MAKTTIRLWTWTRWAPLLALTATLAACGAAVAPDPPTTEPATTPAPADRQATCVDLGIRLTGLGRGIHGAIVSDTLHMGGATAPATCTEPANQSLAAGVPMPDGRTEQAQQAQSRYYLIVINYPGGNRLYVITRRADGTSCVVDTNDQCIAQVTDLPDDFDLQDLPEDVRPTIPAGRPAPPTVSPPPGDETPPAVEPPPNGYTPPAVSPPPAAGTPPGAAVAPQPSTGATGVTVSGPLLSWAAAPRALSYDVYWGTTKELAADTERGTPINTSSTFVTIALTASLEHETLYYWRVDAKNEAGTTRGAVWSFTTAAATAPAPAPPDEETPAPDEEELPTISLSADKSVLESDTSPIRFELTLSSPVTIPSDYKGFHILQWEEDGTATSPADYQGHWGTWGDLDCNTLEENPTLKICGRNQGPMYVTIYDDQEKEEDETFYLRIRPFGRYLTPDDQGEKGADPFPVTCGRCRAKITIIDDD